MYGANVHEYALVCRIFLPTTGNIFAPRLRAGIYSSTVPTRYRVKRTPHHMALTQSLDTLAPQSAGRQVQRNNVIPFPSARALLCVTLPHSPHDHAGTQLRALLHSPLGVYVISTENVREEIRVQLDIARDDLDFTLHTLLTTLPAAMIGPLKRRASTASAH